MAVRVPGAWAVVAVAALAGVAVGSAGTVFRSRLTPWQVGDLMVVSGPIPADAPRAESGETKHDFGTIGIGMTGSHRFEIRNGGRGPLTLARGSSSCSCTVSDFESAAAGSPETRKVVQPGESGFVTVTWRGKPPGGPFRQQVTILSDDPRRPEIVFVVEGTVVPTWRAMPESITLPRLATSTGGQAAATIFVYGDEPPQVQGVTIDDPRTAPLFSLATVPLSAAEVAAEPGAAGGFRIELAVLPGLPIGPLKRTISARFTMPEEVTAEIPLVGTVGGDLVLAGPGWDSSRQALVLGTVSGRTGFKRRIFLTAKGPHRDQVRPLVRETVPDTLQVTIGQGSPVGSGSVVRIPIDIAIRPGSRGSNHLCSDQGPAGRIVLATGHPESPELSIPVCIAVGP